MVDRQTLSCKFIESLTKAKKTTGEHIKRSDTGKGIITEVDVSIIWINKIRVDHKCTMYSVHR